MTRSRRVALGLALAVLVVLAGCAGMGGDDAELEATGSADAGAEAQGGQAESTSGGSAGDAERAYYQAQQRRQLIRTGEVRLEVDSFDGSSRNLTAAVRDRGGFVSDTRQQVHRRGNETWTSGRLVFRVPSGEFDGFLERVKREGTVEESSTDSEDVTDQLVDLEARLENLRAERDQLRTLYDEANGTEEVLAVQERLSDVQGEIERLEARKQSIEDRVAYSTVTVTLKEPVPESTPRVAHTSWYETGVAAAFLESVDGVFVVLRAMIVGAAYIAPYLLAFGLPIAFTYAAWSRIRR